MISQPVFPARRDAPRAPLGFRTRITPSPCSEAKNTIPAASSARQTLSRVSSRTSRPLSDSRRLRAVRATKALSASISCVQPRSARAARTWREVIMHDHLHRQRPKRHENDYNSRRVVISQQFLNVLVAPTGRAVVPIRSRTFALNGGRRPMESRSRSPSLSHTKTPRSDERGVPLLAWLNRRSACGCGTRSGCRSRRLRRRRGWRRSER